MNIIEKSSFNEGLKESGYHVLTFAETGFAMLNQYGEQFGLDKETIEKFSQEINRKNESGSLYPQAPISAVPRHLIREKQNAAMLASEIIDFLKANQNHIQAKKLLLDFRAGVAPFVVEACKIALKTQYAKGIDEVVIITDLAHPDADTEG
jgi:hypothetical protein